MLRWASECRALSWPRLVRQLRARSSLRSPVSFDNPVTEERLLSCSAENNCYVGENERW